MYLKQKQKKHLCLYVFETKTRKTPLSAVKLYEFSCYACRFMSESELSQHRQSNTVSTKLDHCCGKNTISLRSIEKQLREEGFSVESRVESGEQFNSLEFKDEMLIWAARCMLVTTIYSGGVF